MKKLLAIMFGLAGLAGTATAALTANIVLKVLPTGTKSISVSTGAVDFGSIALGTRAAAANVSGSSVTVTNIGNIVTTLGLRVSTADGTWTDVAGTTSLVSVMDQYNLRALFNGNTAPAAGAFGAAVVTNDIRAGAAVLASGSVYAGAETGLNVPPSGPTTRGLWFRWDMPDFSSVDTQRQVTVEVSAN